jgi:molybdenum cofactor guanylyltransferase
MDTNRATSRDTIDPQHITGLVLAGGRGSRMGGVDKGLQNFQGMPLALHAVMRLGPQVGALMVNANRNLAAYESMGVPVWPDATTEFPGPLAGFLVGLERCETPYLVTVPCDSPQFPLDLVARLAAALVAEGADLAIAVTREADGMLQTHPVFCLLKSELMESLVAFMAGGHRRIDRWTAQHPCAHVVFDREGDVAGFFNANTLDELRSLSR